MTDETLSSGPHENIELLTQLGRLVVAWNDLEAVMRSLIFVLTEYRDPLTAIILTADMNSTSLITVLRTMVLEGDDSEQAMFVKRQNDEMWKRLGSKTFQPIAPHVNHFVEYCDRLREFRNFYVHGIRRADPMTGVVARSTTARGRLSFYSQTISIDDLIRLAANIDSCKNYGDTLSVAITDVHKYRFREDAQLPTWPEKPALPDRLQRTRRALRDHEPLPPLTEA